MNKLWKFIFWLLATVIAISFVRAPFINPSPIDLLVLAFFSTISLIPLYGFAYQRAIGSKAIATGMFVINSPYIGYGIWQAVDYFIKEPSIFQAFFSLISILLAGLFLYPIYAYAFKSNNLWQHDA